MSVVKQCCFMPIKYYAWLPQQDGAGQLDLLSLVALDEADLMRTLDGQVRADVAAAARLLARVLHTCDLLSPLPQNRPAIMTQPRRFF